MDYLLPLCFHEDGADGLADRNDLPGGTELPSLLIDLEYHDVVRILILGQQPLSRRVESEMPGRLAATGEIIDWGKLPVGGVHRKGGDAVVTPV